MRRIQRVAKRLFVALLLLTATALALGYLAAYSRLPQVDGRLSSPGLTDEVTVRRDHLGVPHITAGNEADAWHAVGFVHAQDRFFQMDLVRRLVSGRLAEVLGQRALGSDRDARRRQVAAVAERQFALLPADDRAMLEAYARGVNAGLAATGRPVEMLLLAYRPEPWSARDCLLVAKHMENMLADDGGELDRASLADAVGRDVAEYLFDFQGMAGATILDDADGCAGRNSPGAVPAVVTPPAKTAFPEQAEVETQGVDGSNSWVIGGGRTQSGLPLLANDTHLAATAPAIFYQIHVRFPGVDVVGMTVPGVAYVMLGHNQRVAWGVTVLMADQVDYVRLQIDPSDATRFRHREGWSQFETSVEHIRVRGGDDVEVHVRRSPYGPVTSDDDATGRAEMSVSDRLGRTAVAARAMQRADSVAELLAATRDFSGPGMNIIAGDVEGRIGYRAAAAVPDRGGRTGRYPVDAITAEPWQGLLSWERAPMVVDPSAGFIVTANNRIGCGAEAMTVADWWSQPWRADRITELLSATTQHDVESVARLQLDTQSARADAILNALPTTISDADVSGWWKRLKGWDRRFGKGVEPTLYELFERALQRQVFQDDVGERWSQASIGLLKAIEARRFADLDPAVALRDWVDDSHTPAVETIDVVVTVALKDAVAELRRRFGDEEAGWSWEHLHTLAPPHPLGRLPVVGRLFAIDPKPVTGTWHTVNATAGSEKADFRVRHIPVMRMVVDLGDLRRSQIVNSTGQSGHFLSRHYRDQFDDFVGGRLQPMIYAEADVQAATTATLVLVP